MISIYFHNTFILLEELNSNPKPKFLYNYPPEKPSFVFLGVIFY